MKKLWDKIKAKDVKKAIELFDKSNEKYPEPRNTFLIYNNKIYPAKHIRGLAYFFANKIEISKNDYSGGQETANFCRISRLNPNKIPPCYFTKAIGTGA